MIERHHRGTGMLDILAVGGMRIFDIDQDYPCAFIAHIAEIDRPKEQHTVLVLRLGGFVDEETSRFRPKYIEVLCHTCSEIEFYALTDIEELADMETGELLTVEQVAGRLRLKM